MKKLLDLGVETRPFFYPLHKQKILNKNYRKMHLPNSEYISKNGFYIPSGLGITNDEIKFVIKEVNKILA